MWFLSIKKYKKKFENNFLRKRTKLCTKSAYKNILIFVSEQSFYVICNIYFVYCILWISVVFVYM